MQRNYEAVVIVDPRLEDAAIQQAVEKFTKVIATQGEMAKIDEWGKRRLAYQIDHLNEGHYVVADFKAEPELIGELDRLLSIGEEYIRHKIVRVP
ncbi:MAG: 30S ribosomal protein S6 [Actinomycetota bacterium]